ncbi:MAG: DMT family transporter [Anaerolineae bacterium]|nr:DMT family transporter [Anaerolineae bacterium]
MHNRFSSHTRAVLYALFVTFLWSTSWVLIKIGLKDIPALTFAGLRYTLAFGCLLFFAVRGRRGKVFWSSLQGLSPLTLRHWGIILWLAIVNSALAYTLWNHSLRVLSVMESSLINNTMLFQIALLAWGVLGERMTWQQTLGMVVAAAGVLMVQVRPRQRET